MGPVHPILDETHLNRLLATARWEGINVQFVVDGSGRRIYRFRARGGLIRGSTWPPEVERLVVMLAYGHPFNPLRWSADRRLLRAMGPALK